MQREQKCNKPLPTSETHLAKGRENRGLITLEELKVRLRQNSGIEISKRKS